MNNLALFSQSGSIKPARRLIDQGSVCSAAKVESPVRLIK